MTSRSVALWGRSVPAPDGQKRYHNLANSSSQGGAWLKANKPDQELGLPPPDGVEESKEKESDEMIDISEDTAQQTTESSQNCKSNFTPAPATR